MDNELQKWTLERLSEYIGTLDRKKTARKYFLKNSF